MAGIGEVNSNAMEQGSISVMVKIWRLRIEHSKWKKAPKDLGKT